MKIKNRIFPFIFFWKIILSITIQNCESKKENIISKNEKIILVGLLAYTNSQNSSSSECGNGYGKENSLFYNPAYYDTFLNYKTGTTNLVIGDSTMDISIRYTGFLSDSSKSIAVSGNTFCDMYLQFKKIDPTVNNSIISTSGGNDLLQKISNERIEAIGKLLLNQVKSKQSGKMVVVGIHPTKVDYANNNKNDLNTRIKTYTESLGGCFYDPSELFTLDSSAKASDSDMLDDIHYNETISFKIKDKINSVCGIAL